MANSDGWNSAGPSGTHRRDPLRAGNAYTSTSRPTAAASSTGAATFSVRVGVAAAATNAPPASSAHTRCLTASPSPADNPSSSSPRPIAASPMPTNPAAAAGTAQGTRENGDTGEPSAGGNRGDSGAGGSAGSPVRRWGASLVTAGLLAVVAATTAARPLYHADLWGHLAYGRFIWNHGLPANEPLMPLSAGEAFVDFAWLAQVAGYLLHEAAGVRGLQLVGGLLVAAAAGGVGVAARRRCGPACGARAPAWAGWLAGALFLAAAWMQLFAFAPWRDGLGRAAVRAGWGEAGFAFAASEWSTGWAPQMLRPQTLAIALFAALAAATPVPRRPGWRWWGLPAAFLLWANCHGSWPIGLAWLAADLFAAAARRVRRGGWRVAARSARVRRGAGLLALCAAAVCVNPLGPGAYPEAATFGRHPNLADVIEWKPLTAAMVQGRVFFLLSATLMVLPLLTRRLPRAAVGLPLVAFGLATVFTSRWALWWAVPAAIALTAQVVPRSPPPSRRLRRRTHLAPWPAGLLLGTALAPLLWVGGPSPYAAGTPLAAAAYLRERPPGGLIFNSHAHGDTLLWAGPPGTEVFVASHAHLIPPAVWEDAKLIGAGRPGWERALDRYGVAALCLSPGRDRTLTTLAERSPHWRRVFLDRDAEIFTRERPAPPPPPSGPASGATAAPSAATPADAPAAATPAPPPR